VTRQAGNANVRLFSEDRDCTLPRITVAVRYRFLSDMQAFQAVGLHQVVAGFIKLLTINH
jgi:hypothetical protein